MSDGSAPDRTGASVPAPLAADPAPSYHWPFGEAASTPPPQHVRRPRKPRRSGAGSVVGVAALTALLVGAGAGFGAARLTGDPEAAGPSDRTTSADPSPAPLPSGATTSTVEVARRVLPGTVMIQVGSGIGSGFVIDRQGHVLTNNHVIADAAGGGRIRVVFADGRQATATLVGRSPSYDLAVIKVTADDRLRPLELGDSSTAKVGAPVVAVGSPLGLPGTVTQGIVSALDRPVTVNESGSADAPTAYIDGIQTDAAINPGTSGGPLVDAGARVIGVSSAILTLSSGQGQAGSIGIGFAIPVNQAKTIGSLLIKNGKATYPVVGATLSETAGGVELTGLEAGGAARKAGLEVGDLVSTVDGRPVESREELVVIIRTHRPGDKVTLGYSRGAGRAEAELTLGGRVG